MFFRKPKTDNYKQKSVKKVSFTTPSIKSEDNNEIKPSQVVKEDEKYYENNHVDLSTILKEDNTTMDINWNNNNFVNVKQVNNDSNILRKVPKISGG